jgi:hypothetical protein
VQVVVGESSVALSTLVVANTHANFFKEYTIWFAIGAAVASLMMATLNPQKTAKGFVNAYRHLEKAIARFRFDSSVPVADLGKAEADGIDLGLMASETARDRVGPTRSRKRLKADGACSG